jgi:SAM-dependent methyltransferase
VSGAIEEHHGYLQDERRNSAYAKAFEAVVEPGARILDLGCGTGLLGLLALRAGAGHVDAVEATALIEVARELAAGNGRSDQVTHHHVWSTSLTLPEPVDVVVCDQADGIFGLECGLVDTFPDARDRLAGPGARLVPMSITPLLVPVRAPSLRRRLASMGSAEGFDTSALLRHAEASVWYLDGDSIEVCGAELVGEPIDLTGPVGGPVRVSGLLEWEGEPPDALACGFRVELAPGIGFSNSPSADDVIDRGIPVVSVTGLAGPTPVNVAFYPGSGVLRWRVGTGDAQVVRSTLDGLLEGSLLRRLNPDLRPTPTEKGRQVAALLEAADGERTGDQLREQLPASARELVDSLLSDGYLA